MNYKVTVNDLVVQGYWKKEAWNLSVICTVQEESPFMIPDSEGVWGLLSPETVRDRTFFPLFWVSCMTGCFWQYFHSCSGKLGGRETSCWLMHTFRMDLSLWRKEIWKNRITIFIKPADGIAQASMFEFCMKRKTFLNKNYPSKKAPNSWHLLLTSMFCLGFSYT